jgi:hypothetical protein
MRTPRLLVSLAVLGVLVAGCGAAGDAGGSAADGGAGSSASASPTPDAGSGMDMDMGSADKPSAPAAMICGAEIRDAVRRAFTMSGDPVGTSSWDREGRVFSCSWRVPGGRLAMSVQDATEVRAGRAHFAALRKELPGARSITGMQALGFPAFDTKSGNVVFLKDGKTLRVDATSLSEDALPQGFTRRETAYSVAAAVIGCWTE